jgi:hypothetical protein
VFDGAVIATLSFDIACIGSPPCAHWLARSSLDIDDDVGAAFDAGSSPPVLVGEEFVVVNASSRLWDGCALRSAASIAIIRQIGGA